MMELFKQSMMFGLGVAATTKEKTEELINEMVEKGKVSRGEAEKFVEEMMDRSQEKQKELRSYMQEYIDAYNEKVGIPTKKEFDALEKRVLELEEKIAVLEKNNK